MWIPVHVSEPTANLEALVTCTFNRHAPTLVGEEFDVLVTLAGNASDGREAELAGVVRRATAGLTPQPAVRTEFVFVAKDDYDRDQSKDEKSSYAGPNTVFYSVMLEDKDKGNKNRDGGAENGGAERIDGGLSMDHDWPENNSAKVVLRSSTPPSLYRTLISPYAFVQVMETDCCALQAGWLDALLAPMLADHKLLISGSRPRGACFSPTDQGGGSQCRTDFPDFVRLHINGNAMYRVGPAMQTLLHDAWDLTRDEAPFDLAMYLVRSTNQSHVYDNPSVYSVAGSVDSILWMKPAYYGGGSEAVFVHAPRRMRVDGVTAVASRANKKHRTVAVVVAPTTTTDATLVPGGAGAPPDLAGGRPDGRAPLAGDQAGTPSPAGDSSLKAGLLAVDVPLLRGCHSSLVAAHADRNLIYIALTWPAFVEASRLAPFRVLLANGTRPDDATAWPDPADLAVRALTASSALARSGLGLLVMGTDAAIVQPDLDLDVLDMESSVALTDSVAGKPALTVHTLVRLLDTPHGAAPLAPAGPLSGVGGQRGRRAVLDVGMMKVAGSRSAADFLECWAGGLNAAGATSGDAVGDGGRDATTAGRSAPLVDPVNWRTAAGVAAALPTCTVRSPSYSPWRKFNLTVGWLPAEAYAAGASYWGPAWSDAARAHSAFVVAAGITPPGRHPRTPPEFRLRQAGLWQGGPAAGCANYSAVSRTPLALGPDLASVHRAFARHARFLRGVADRGIACAVLPGFRVAATGNAVPFDAVLRADVVARLAGGDGDGGEGRTPAVRFYPNAAALDVAYEDFMDLDGGAGGVSGFAAAPFTGRHQVWAGDGRAGAGPATAGLAGLQPAVGVGDSTLPPQHAGAPLAAARACTAFGGVPGTACFAPDVATAINAAAAALPPRFWCVTDPGRSPAEAAVLALEGRLHEVDAAVREAVASAGSAGRPPAATTSAAWDAILLTGAPWRATASARAAGDRGAGVLTLADLPGGSGFAPSSDPITRLVRPDAAGPPGSAAASPWADVIEYALCQAGLGVAALPPDGLPGLLAAAAPRPGRGHASPPPPFLPSALLPRLAAHIPPAMLQEDLDAFAVWLARPDRPGLGGRWVRTRWPRGGQAGHDAGHNATSPCPAPLTKAGAVDAATDTARRVHALGASLGFVPGLPPRGDGAGCAGRPAGCPPPAWSAAFGPGVLRDTYASVRGLLLPPVTAVLMHPETAGDVLRECGMPLAGGGPAGFPASLAQAGQPRQARALAVLGRVLDARCGGQTHRLPSPTMWMEAQLPVSRLARLSHFVGDASTVVMDGRRGEAGGGPVMRKAP